MDQFSHDLTLALEETSLLDKATRNRWGQRRRTRSTGNLPCAPQPTEDSSSSPTDAVAPLQKHTNTNVDGLDTHNVALPSDSDEKEEVLRLPCKSLNSAIRCIGAMESDSLNETFSPARFFKPNARRKRKLKRMSVEFDVAGTSQHENNIEASLLTGTGTLRKRVLKPEIGAGSNIIFCGKRKRSNRDRYHDYDHAKAHSSSVPRHNLMEEYRMRPRSFSSTSKVRPADRLLPLNKGLLSKIERISQLQKTNEPDVSADRVGFKVLAPPSEAIGVVAEVVTEKAQPSLSKQPEPQPYAALRKKSGRSCRQTQLQQQLQFVVDQHPMDCGELNDFLSSSSLSSSESDDDHAANDTDREGDDELTDWPGNEGSGPPDGKFDSKRKLTKKSNLPQIKSDDGSGATLAEDDTLMSGSGDWLALDMQEPTEVRYQPSEPITINSRTFAMGRSCVGDANSDMSIPLKQIESEMSGETSRDPPFLSSPPCQATEVREIRAGCRRVKGERPGFTIKTSVNERLARFLQDPRQSQIRLPDIEIYEHDSLINLATLYSLHMSLDNGCAVLNKTSNTTQSVDIDEQSLQGRLLFSDFKRRCYDSKSAGNIVPRK